MMTHEVVLTDGKEEQVLARTPSESLAYTFKSCVFDKYKNSVYVREIKKKDK